MDYKKPEKLIPYDEGKWVRNRWLLMMYDKYEDYYRNEIERIIRNQRMYWGVNFGQWPAYVVEKLRAQGRRPHQYNLTAKKIESQIGSFIANGFDIKYMTVSGRHNEPRRNSLRGAGFTNVVRTKPERDKRTPRACRPSRLTARPGCVPDRKSVV